MENSGGANKHNFLKSPILGNTNTVLVVSGP